MRRSPENAAANGGRSMKKQEFPPGWNEKRVREVIAHYENQSEEEQSAEIEAALKAEDMTMVSVPTSLVPKVLSLIQRRKRTA